MASLQDQAEQVKIAVASVATCTPTTTVLLKSLLLPNDNDTPSTNTKDSKATKPARATSTRRNGAASRAAEAKRAAGEDKAELSAKEKAMLATHIINATLKALGEAAKAPPPAAPKEPAGEEDLVRSTARRRIRRSNSAPMTPMQPRSLNRVSTSPDITRKPTKSPTRSNASTGCLSTVECARIAFSALRALQTAGNITLPELQLEAGMSSLVGKLIALGLMEHAVKELRLLKKRLDDLIGSGKGSSKTASGASSLKLSELLAFGDVKASGQLLNLVLSTQMQVLRIMSKLKRPVDTEGALPLLQPNSTSSPMKLLLMSAGTNEAEKAKAARQLETLSQILIALAPSTSSSEDETASEPKLSVSPLSALELQTIALQSRLTWWKLAGHKSDVDKDILTPLSKCFVAYVRRTQKTQSSDYNGCLALFDNIHRQFSSQNLEPSSSSKSALASIYQTLAKLAREAGHYSDAISWAEKLSQTVDRSRDSAAKCCATSALLLAYRLKMAWKYPVLEPQIKEVLEGLQGQLRGDSSELDELLDSLIMALKSAVNVLFGDMRDGEGGRYRPPTDFAGLLESLILQLPRFCLRWLGKRPSSQDDTKGFLRYEQRRTVLVKSAPQILDSALLLAKTSIAEKAMAWDKLDVLLHDCIGLLDSLGDLASMDPSSYYHAKISHLYYVQHTNFMNASKKSKADAKENLGLALRAMRRSIDCVKHRSSKEREKAQVLYKLERMSELYRDTGRSEDALAALQTLRTILIEDGVLASVSQALKSLSPRQAWAISQSAESLSWSLRSIARTEQVWVDWTFHLDEPERLAALEHRLDLILSRKVASTGTVGCSEPCVEALLQLCSVDRYPVRRLRILTRLQIANISNAEQLEIIQAHMEEVAAISDEADLGEDAGLKGALLHMQALSKSMLSLACHPPDHERIQQCLSIWQSILQSSKDAADLNGRVDDVPELLEHLQSVADYARLSNRNGLLLTALQLAFDLSRKAAIVDIALSLQISTALALQLANVGQSSKAATVLEQAKQSFQPGHAPGREEIVRFFLSHAEYFVEIGNVEKADESLAQAKEAALTMDLTARSRTRRLMLAQASLMYSSVALGRGDAPCALTHARNASRVLFQEWHRLEQQGKSASPNTSSRSADESATNMDASVTEVVDKSKAVSPSISGPEAWKLAHPVLRGLLFLSNTYAHLGMYQETVYYAEQAQKVAQAAGSEAYLIECDAWMSSVSAKAGKLEDALKSVSEAKSMLEDGDYSSKLIGLCCRLSNVYREVRDFESEKAMIETAEAMVRSMTGHVYGIHELQDATAAETKTTKLSVGNKRTTATAAMARKTRATATNVVPKTAPTATSTPAISESVGLEDAHLASLKASVIVEKASSMIYQKDWTGAWELLQELRQSSTVASHVLSELVTTAKSLLGQSMDQMAKDAVYSVIQESTLSFPSVCSTSLSDKGSDRFSLIKASPPAKVALAPFPQENDVLRPSHGYLENLREAREHLLEAHALASVMGDGREVHRILGMLQTVVILLSAASPSPRKTGIIGHPGYATCSIDIARNLTWRREYKALLTEKSSGRDGLEWPEDMRPAEDRRTSLSPVVDMSRFQREYIDIIPAEWSVISISLSDNKHDLCISKLQTGHSPFVIRLPLERASSRDADNEVFNFLQGRTELLDIIKQANASCHTKRDFSVKGARTAWWAEREALDVRLKELLVRIEEVWLGGFKGIFSQHQQHPDLLVKFQKSFHNTLDKHLPSRRQVRGKNAKSQETSAKVALDWRVLELFIGLGDATDTESDFDEMLNDLLYFVVDILQFHGERNAYDEIDFDSMVVETMDALHSYHADANSLSGSKTRNHTILVLDKALHTFPWESLPCLQGLAVSRVPSLACLRRLILEQRTPSTEPPKSSSTGHPTGHHVSIKSGTYMLNTSGDLKTTQATFESPLSTLNSSWKHVVKKAPTEAEFETALSSSDILLYMGHGGGAQYIRNRTIRRLDKCRATTLLMGCSSASLADVGGFECYGLVWSYMLAGCPAVVGTLWDVTDRDIDLYTGRVFEEWGLVAKGTFPGREDAKGGKGNDGDSTEGNTRKAARGGSRKRAAEDGNGGDTACEYGDASLPEAVARARNAGICKFKYLNAAAVCVYGIPVYVDRGGR
ncbi:Separin [Cytospora mali]|uniref:separase n=1 Tax=Cytospora mali TaxID=578113 RepID=A0A194V4C8_CYTMA|nr:Separin [Valsa mali var. pyri (nom. inval.)]